MVAIGTWIFKKALTLKTEGTLDDHAVTKGYVDSIVQGLGWTVLDKDLTDPPGSPPTGGRYIVASVATGDWTGHEEKIAEWSGSAWSFETPSEGWEIWVADENVWYVYDGVHPAGSWVKLGSTITHSNLLGLDVPDDHLSYLTLDGLRPMTGLLTTPGIKIPVDGDIKIYNTADQTINYERAVFEWIPGIFKISTQKGGSGLNRSIDIVNAWGTGFRLNDAIMALKGSSGGEYLINTDSFASLALRGRVGNTNTQSVRLGNSATFGSTNGQQTFVAVTANLGQSGTAGYTALEIDAIEGSVGSGAKNLIDAKVDGVSKLICDNTGLLSFGPKTAAFPAWKRDGTALGAWLADNSAYTAVKCSEVRVFNAGGQSGYLNHDGSNLFVGDTAGTVIFSPGGNIRGWFDTSGLTITKDCTVYAAQLFRWANSTRMSAPADGSILFQNAGEDDFGLLQFGGVTAAFGAIGRNGAGVAIRLADDTGYGTLDSGLLTMHGDIDLGANKVTFDDGLDYIKSEGSNTFGFYINNVRRLSLGSFALDIQTTTLNLRNAYAYSSIQALRLGGDGTPTHGDTTGQTYVAGTLEVTDVLYAKNTISVIGSIGGTGRVKSGATSYHHWSSRSEMYSPADGDILLTNDAVAGFRSLQLGPAAASDIVPSDVGILAGNAWAQASVNQDGADLNLAGGIGTRQITIVDYTGLASETVTIVIDDVDNDLVEGFEWDAEISNDVTATNLAAAIDGLTGASSESTAAVVFVTPDAHLRSLALESTDVTDLTLTQGDDGNLRFGSNTDAVGNYDYDSTQARRHGSAGAPTTMTDTPGYDVFNGRVSFEAVTYFENGINVEFGDILTYGNIRADSGRAFYWNNRSEMRSPIDGSILFQNAAEDDFGLLQFGGITAAFSALKRSGAGLDVRLADDSDYGAFRCGPLTIGDSPTNNVIIGGNPATGGVNTALRIAAPTGYAGSDVLLQVENNLGQPRMRVYSDGTVRAEAGFESASTSIFAGRVQVGIGYYDENVGKIDAENFNNTLALVGNKASGAGNKALLLAADVNAASIDSAHKITSWGWINNSNIYAEVAHLTADGSLIASRFETAKTMDTLEGGRAIKLTNKTGVASVKGIVVKPSSSTDYAVDVCGADGVDPIGVVYEDGIADGSEVWVVISGIAEVLLEDSTATTRGYWARTSITQAGRADITAALPPEGTIQALENHFSEIGHSIQSVTAGTDKLARIVMHIN